MDDARRSRWSQQATSPSAFPPPLPPASASSSSRYTTSPSITSAAGSHPPPDLAIQRQHASEEEGPVVDLDSNSGTDDSIYYPAPIPTQSASASLPRMPRHPSPPPHPASPLAHLFRHRRRSRSPHRKHDDVLVATASGLEKEAYGDSNAGDAVKDGQRIFSVDYMGHCIHFLYMEDLLCFREIREFKESNPERTMEDALDAFADRDHADALIKIVYLLHTATLHWDAVLKHDLDDDDSDYPDPTIETTERQQLRHRFELELLRAHLFLVRERGTDLHALKTSLGAGVGRRKMAHYVKVLAPFDVLCAEAERIRMRVEAPNRFQRIHEALRARVSRDRHQFHQHRSSTTPDSSSSPSPSPVPQEASEGPAKIKFRVKPFREGPDGTLRGMLRYMFSLVSTNILLDTEPFRVEELKHYQGGDMDALGRAKVVSRFFSNSRRNYLTQLIVKRCRVRKLSTDAKTHSIFHLIRHRVYSDLYATHCGPHARPKRSRRLNPTDPEPPWQSARSELHAAWAAAPLRLPFFLCAQPLRMIRNYYGERTAFYFAWLAYYTSWLWIAALLGLVVFVLGASTRGTRIASPPELDPTTGRPTLEEVFDSGFTAPYAFAMAIWYTTMLEFWKRQEITLRTVWEVGELAEGETRNPGWYGTVYRRSAVTGKLEPHFPKALEVGIKSVTTGVLLFTILVMIAVEVMLIIVHSQTVQYFETAIASAINGGLALINILLITPLYLKLAKTLNRWENHKTLEKQEDAYIHKRYLFSFVQNFSNLIYIGVLKVYISSRIPVIADTCSATDPSLGSCFQELTQNMVVIFIGVQFFNQAQQLIWPEIRKLLLPKSLRHQLKTGECSGTYDQAQHLNDDVLDTFKLNNEYTAKVVQFGFVAMFSCAFPLAPLFALVNNLIEMRAGAYRLVAGSRRGFIERAGGIGAWNSILSMTSRIAIMVNGLIIAFSSRHFNTYFLRAVPSDYKLTAQLGFVILFEHIVRLIVFFIDKITPDIPGKVRHALDRERYLQRLENGEELEADDDVEHVDFDLSRVVRGQFAPPPAPLSGLRSRARKQPGPVDVEEATGRNGRGSWGRKGPTKSDSMQMLLMRSSGSTFGREASVDENSTSTTMSPSPQNPLFPPHIVPPTASDLPRSPSERTPPPKLAPTVLHAPTLEVVPATPVASRPSSPIRANPMDMDGIMWGLGSGSRESLHPHHAPDGKVDLDLALRLDRKDRPAPGVLPDLRQTVSMKDAIPSRTFAKGPEIREPPNASPLAVQQDQLAAANPHRASPPPPPPSSKPQPQPGRRSRDLAGPPGAPALTRPMHEPSTGLGGQRSSWSIEMQRPSNGLLVSNGESRRKPRRAATPETEPSNSKSQRRPGAHANPLLPPPPPPPSKRPSAAPPHPSHRPPPALHALSPPQPPIPFQTPFTPDRPHILPPLGFYKPEPRRARSPYRKVRISSDTEDVEPLDLVPQRPEPPPSRAPGDHLFHRHPHEKPTDLSVSPRLYPDGLAPGDHAAHRHPHEQPLDLVGDFEQPVPRAGAPGDHLFHRHRHEEPTDLASRNALPDRLDAPGDRLAVRAARDRLPPQRLSEGRRTASGSTTAVGSAGSAGADDKPRAHKDARRNLQPMVAVDAGRVKAPQASPPKFLNVSTGDDFLDMLSFGDIGRK
ncbi:Anoctamin-7 [Phlyctochytrium bullatum]|nr:Anoctamin-7 [Phlyctochytrium bullatum]